MIVSDNFFFIKSSTISIITGGKSVIVVAWVVIPPLPPKCRFKSLNSLKTFVCFTFVYIDCKLQITIYSNAEINNTHAECKVRECLIGCDPCEAVEPQVQLTLVTKL